MNDRDLVSLFKSGLELCRVSADETVAIYSEGGQHPRYVEGVAVAAHELGATVMHIDIPLAGGRAADEIGARADTGLAQTPIAFEALQRCDLVVDLSMLLFTRELTALTEGGVRVLTCTAPPDVVQRLFPTADVRRRAREAEALLDKCEVLELTSAAGTSASFRFGQFRAYCQYGLADERGRWDNFASALVANNPSDGGVDGVVVLQPGDVLYPWGRYVTERVEIRIRNGAITGIDGGFDAWTLREHMARFDDERAYAIGHIGWGINEHAKWDASSELDPRSYYGSVMFSTGPNTEFGGDNDTLCHIDIPMRGCNVRLDGAPVIDNGRMVIPSLAVPGRSPQPDNEGANGRAWERRE